MGFSQTTILSNTQKESLKNDSVKVLALILAEHQKLSIENPILKEKIKNLEELNMICEEQSEIKSQEINLYQKKVTSDSLKINKLQNNNKKTIIGSSIGGVLLFIIGLIL